MTSLSLGFSSRLTFPYSVFERNKRVSTGHTVSIGTAQPTKHSSFSPSITITTDRRISPHPHTKLFPVLGPETDLSELQDCIQINSIRAISPAWSAPPGILEVLVGSWASRISTLLITDYSCGLPLWKPMTQTHLEPSHPQTLSFPQETKPEGKHRHLIVPWDDLMSLNVRARKAFRNQYVLASEETESWSYNPANYTAGFHRGETKALVA